MSSNHKIHTVIGIDLNDKMLTSLEVIEAHYLFGVDCIWMRNHRTYKFQPLAKFANGGELIRKEDLLLGHKLHIVGEVQLLINHCLLGLPGVRKEDLKAVISHPQWTKWKP
ncbi:hypothetical protein JHK86_053135 [Glycine max]|nr:hypothetical protein JHK86_053135 [Glycine max]